MVVVICFQISIFEPLETTKLSFTCATAALWFAFKLVSLNHWRQRRSTTWAPTTVVICFQISIFEPLETTTRPTTYRWRALWFAFKLVSLNHWRQRWLWRATIHRVVICFQISIFEPLETTLTPWVSGAVRLWFAFKLVSLNHWRQPSPSLTTPIRVVICFQISIFEPLETTTLDKPILPASCDLLSN